MDTQARREHFEVERGDWISHAYIPIGEADKKVGSELKNDIHSMFSQELDELPRDATTKARWGELTLEDYELLCPALRLATQLLESPPSSDAICSMAHGDRHPSPEKIVYLGVSIAEFHKHKLPPSDVRETAGKVLKRFGKSIRFCVRDLDERSNDDHTAHGRTIPADWGFPQGVAVTDRRRERGVASLIMLNTKFLIMLKEMLVEPSGKQLQILKHNFELALTICHEVIHAIGLALPSDFPNQNREKRGIPKTAPFVEPFYQGQDVAELGYFWENHVFGGACHSSMPIRENPLFISEWPSWIFWSKGQQPEKVLPKIRALKWLVSAYYIKNIQTQEFWDRINVQHSQDLLALRIRKRVAVKCFMPPNYTDYDKTWDPDAPENWLGRSGRVPFTDDDPSPGARLANETHDERDERLHRERQMLS